MLYKGQKRSGPRVETVVFPRQGGNDFIINAACVRDYTKFDGLCPAPKPPEGIQPGSMSPVPLFDDPAFKEAQRKWAGQRMTWMILESLKATPEIQWESVNPDDPATWENYDEELKEAGFSDFEIMRIVNLVLSACGLDQAKIDEATTRFLAGQVAPVAK